MTIKENTQAILEQMELLEKAKTITEAKDIFSELERLEKERIVIMSHEGETWHEAYSAGMGNACKLMVDTLERIEKHESK